MQNPIPVGVLGAMKRPCCRGIVALLVIMVQANALPLYAAPKPMNQLKAAASSSDLIHSPNETFIADDFCLEVWRRERMPLKVYFHPCDDVAGFDSRFKQSFQNACSNLSAAMSNAITFEFVDTSDGADIDVYWTPNRDNWPPNPWKDAIGLCERQPDTDVAMQHASIFLLTRYEGHNKLGPKFMEETCLHELGHACGLGHSLRSTDVMCQHHWPASFNSDGEFEITRDPIFTSRDAASLKILTTAQQKIISIREGCDRRTACDRLNDEAFALIRKSDNGQALIYLRAAVELDGSNKLAMQNAMVALFNCAVELNNSNHYSEALPLLKKALSLGQKVGTKTEVAGILKVQQNCQAAAK